MARRKTSDMHHITRRGDGQYRVQIRRSGAPVISETWPTLPEAQARRDELLSQVRRGSYRDESIAKRTTWQALATDYRAEHSGLGRTDIGDLRRLDEGLGDTPIAEVTPARLALHVRDRGRTVGPQQLRHEISICGRVIRWGMRHRGLHLETGDPTQYVELPRLPPGRDRRLLVTGPEPWQTEEYWLLEAGARSRSPDIRDIIVLAIETGMRCEEIALLKREYIDWHRSIVRLPRTKNGTARSVPLSPRAVEVLRARPAKLLPLTADELEARGGMDNRVWSLTTAGSVSQCFHRVNRGKHGGVVPIACKLYLQRCETEAIDPDPRMFKDLHFHDLRHEAASRLAPHFQAQELAAIFGWRDPAMVMRYYQPRAEDFAARLAEFNHAYNGGSMSLKEYAYRGGVVRERSGKFFAVYQEEEYGPFDSPEEAQKAIDALMENKKEAKKWLKRWMKDRAKPKPKPKPKPPEPEPPSNGGGQGPSWP